MFLARLLEPRFGRPPALLHAVDIGVHHLQCGRIDELLERETFFDIAHSLHHQTTEADEKAGEQDGNQPQCTLHPFFGKT